MAHTIENVVVCSSCNGAGSRIIGYEDGEPVYENPCSGCEGDGQTTISRIDDTLLNDILDKVNDVLGKCNDILEQLQE